MKGWKPLFVILIGLLLIVGAEIYFHRAVAVLILILYLPVVALLQTVTGSVRNYSAF